MTGRGGASRRAGLTQPRTPGEHKCARIFVYLPVHKRLRFNFNSKNVPRPYLALDKHVAMVEEDADEQTAVAFLLSLELQDTLGEVDEEAEQGGGAYNGAHVEVAGA